MTGRNIPAIIDSSREIIEGHYLRGEFALSPKGIPSVAWKRAAQMIADEDQVAVEIRVDPKTDQCMVRLNRGFPKGIVAFSDEAKEWMSKHPTWAADQRLWHDTSRGLC